MKLAYRAFEKSGREVTDVIDAPSVAEATDRLRHRDLFVADIGPASSGAPAADKPAPLGGLRPAGRAGLHLPQTKTSKLKDVAMFTRQLYMLIKSGTPLADGLRSMERQTRSPAWCGVIAEIRSKVEGGLPLSAAMATRPDYFDEVYRNMIAAGETSGKLVIVLDRLAQLIRKRIHVRRTVQGAMIYPILLTVVSTGVFVVMLLLVVPQFKMLFDSLAVPLPSTTRMLIDLSDVLKAYWQITIGVLVAAGVGIKLFVSSQAGRRACDTLVLKLPWVGNLVRSFATARIARLLGVLLDSHLPVLEALQLTRGSVANMHYRKLIDRALEFVSRGQPISLAFKGSDLIHASIYEAMRSGEQSGQLSPLLLDVADFMDEENEILLKGIIGIIEPAMLITMGVMVGFVALSIFTPLFDATGLVGKGG
jgi:type II secretory pathway component PulF